MTGLVPHLNLQFRSCQSSDYHNQHKMNSITYVYLADPILGSPSLRSLNRYTAVWTHSPSLLPKICKFAILWRSTSRDNCKPGTATPQFDTNVHSILIAYLHAGSILPLTEGERKHLQYQQLHINLAVFVEMSLKFRLILA